MNRLFGIFFVLITLLTTGSCTCKYDVISYDVGRYERFFQEVRSENKFDGKNFFYYAEEVTRLLIVEEDDCFVAKSTYFINGEEHTDIYKFSLQYGPLSNLFEYVYEKPIIYQFRENNFIASHGLMVLVESVGIIKLLAEQPTIAPTQKYYKKKYHKEIPLTREQGVLIFELTFKKVLIGCGLEHMIAEPYRNKSQIDDLKINDGE